MSVRTLIVAVVAIGLTAVSAGEAAAQGRGGHCAGGGQSKMPPGSGGSQLGSQPQLNQMRAAYSQQLQLAQMRAVAAQQAQMAQMQLQQQAQLTAQRQASQKQTTLKSIPLKPTVPTQSGPAVAFGSGVTIITPAGSP